MEIQNSGLTSLSTQVNPKGNICSEKLYGYTSVVVTEKHLETIVSSVVPGLVH